VIGQWLELGPRRRTGEHGDADRTCCPRGMQIVCRITHQRHRCGMGANVARKGQDHAGIGLAAMAGIVAGNKLEAVRQSELLRLGDGRGFGIIGGDTEPVARICQRCENGRGLADRRERIQAMKGEEPIHLGMQCRRVGAAERLRPEPAIAGGGARHERRRRIDGAGQRINAIGRSQTAEDRLVALRQRAHDRDGCRPPGEAEIDERPVLVEEDAGQRHRIAPAGAGGAGSAAQFTQALLQRHQGKGPAVADARTATMIEDLHGLPGEASGLHPQALLQGGDGKAKLVEHADADLPGRAGADGLEGAQNIRERRVALVVPVHDRKPGLGGVQLKLCVHVPNSYASLVSSASA